MLPLEQKYEPSIGQAELHSPVIQSDTNLGITVKEIYIFVI